MKTLKVFYIKLGQTGQSTELVMLAVDDEDARKIALQKFPGTENIWKCQEIEGPFERGTVLHEEIQQIRSDGDYR